MVEQFTASNFALDPIKAAIVDPLRRNDPSSSLNGSFRNETIVDELPAADIPRLSSASTASGIQADLLS
jgi:hypothetical protein